MKKKYITPSSEILNIDIMQLMTTSGLETNKPQEDEVDESWSRKISYDWDEEDKEGF